MTYQEAVTTKRVEGSDFVYVDIDFPIIIRTTGAWIPSLTTLQWNLTAPSWAVNDFNMCEAQELIHGWKEWSQINWHVHMVTNGLEAVDKFVKREIEYSRVNINWVLQSNTTTSTEFTIPANTPDKTMLIQSITSFTPTGWKIGWHLYARLKRIVSSWTAPVWNPRCSMLQCHVQVDTIWSKSIGTKI